MEKDVSGHQNNFWMGIEIALKGIAARPSRCDKRAPGQVFDLVLDLGVIQQHETSLLLILLGHALTAARTNHNQLL